MSFFFPLSLTVLPLAPMLLPWAGDSLNVFWGALDGPESSGDALTPLFMF